MQVKYGGAVLLQQELDRRQVLHLTHQQPLQEARRDIAPQQAQMQILLGLLQAHVTGHWDEFLSLLVLGKRY
jgi:hypothetical protein